ncbi:TrkH family potassium uptake protein [Herbiconiux solani]|uniref:TrkH family potassium uptake protein n=1 Tax=Herbiconiux solani TaxID=661329 RepID=UPI000826FEFD|nr:potassium transporter TrkG [Herbiconiux solani]
MSVRSTVASRNPLRRSASVFGKIREAVRETSEHSPSRFAILIFAGLVLLFTVLFSLPVSSATGTPTSLADSLFTAVSVICVTGLSTVDMATHWSVFGHVLIYFGVQIGALGVLTLASILGLVISRRLGLRARLIAASDTNPLRMHHGPVAEGQAVRLGEIGSLLATVAISALVIEAVLALLLLPRMLLDGIPVGDAVWFSLYYSAMAFTNTGFAPNAEGLAPFANDYFFLGVLMVGVFLGSIGFPVIYTLSRSLGAWRSRKRRGHARGTAGRVRWSVHVKLTLVTSFLLIVVGAVLYIVLEFDNPDTFGGLNAGDTVFQSFFLSVMTRSGGFSTISIPDLNGSSLLVTDMLMFIGGGSASTAGGIKVTTLAVLFLAAFAEARGVQDMEAFGRRIPSDVLRLGVSVVLWGATTVAVSSVLILQISKAPLDFVLFDVISAFATSGLTTGLTASLPDAGVYIMAATMFMGRVGTVTLAAALAASQRQQLYKRPEERPIVG